MNRAYGVAVATVLDVQDPAGEGRVLLRFDDLPGEPEGTWAPIAASMAGSGRGAFFLPEVEDEVLVGFHHGKFEFPYVLGFLWNGVDLPPESDPQNRVFVSRTGHALRFEDGNKKVILKSAADQTITFDDNAGNIVVKSGDSTITLDSSSVTILGGGRQIKLSGGSVAIT